MTSSFELGTIRGIRIGVNWSLLLIFALIVWTLARGVFPDQNPGLTDGTYLGMAIAAAVLFFASILAHELGHAFVARREGMEIEGITLWLFGGIARFAGDFRSAGAELRIALAGPAISLLIGLACVGIGRLGLPDAADGVAAWLGYINLLLLVFNLLPALPLDGGRVLRAVLWRARSDYGWATRVSARIGQALGLLVIAAGIALVVLEGTFSGLWLTVLGWFIASAAGDEGRYARAREAFGGLRVRDVMVPEPVTVRPDETLADLAHEGTLAHGFAAYPVVADGQTVGLLPARQLASLESRALTGRRIEDVMLPLDRVAVFRGDEPAVVAATRLARSRIGRGLVLDGGRLVGLLSIDDLVRALRAADARG